jgi:hypothetical protein
MYVKIIDVTNPAPLPGNADGYDLNAVEALYYAVEGDCGCTLTQGYWKNHDEWQGEEDWMEILHTAPKKGNAWLILAHQYIAARLNEMNGAYVPPEIALALSEAEALLGSYTQESPPPKGDPDRDTMIELAELLAGYNEGYTVVPHCSEPPEQMEG